MSKGIQGASLFTSRLLKLRSQPVAFAGIDADKPPIRVAKVQLHRREFPRFKIIGVYSSPAGSVYYPSQKGCEVLAEHAGDDSYLLTPTQCPQPHHIAHWLAVTETHLKLDEATEGQDAVQLGEWINEWDTVNKDEQEPEKRYRLYTLLGDNPRLICAPDSAFMLTALGYTKVFYLEQDRGTTGVRQVVARKSKGYAELASRGCHRSHFPGTNVDSFTVVCIAHNDRRRDALRRAFSGIQGSELWKFCSATDLTAETFLHAPIWYSVSGDPVPLVKLPNESESQS